MTFPEALKKEKKWQRRVHIINLYHGRMLLKNKKWTMRNTAKHLGISLGQVSEGIKLAKAIMEYPQLEESDREVALAWLRTK